MASFDVKSLYPSIPVEEALQQIIDNGDIDPQIIELSRHCLRNAYFVYDGQTYRQTDGAAMGSSLSTAIANLFMIYFEKKAIESASIKPKLWIRYVDDVFVIWSEQVEEVYQFLDHLNSIYPRIQFIIEIEDNNSLPFLDVEINKIDDHLEHTLIITRCWNIPGIVFKSH